MYYVEKTKNLNYLKQFDYLLFIIVLILSAIGMLALSSAVKSNANGNAVLLKQGVSIALGIVIAILLSAFDYKDLKTVGAIFYFIALALLVIVIFKGFGKEEWGSNSWLKVPLIGSLQPSEIAKIMMVIITSIFFERFKDGQWTRKDLIKLLIYAAIPIGLVLLQPDYGTAVVFFFMLAVMIFISGFPYKYILILAGSFVASLPILWFFILKPFQKNRILAFLSPESDPLGRGYQVSRSKLAIGSGQLFGKGLYQGIQTQSNGVPVNESDFIFTVVGEEMGFIGAAVVVLLIVLMLIRCIYIAKNSRDFYGTFIVVGLTGMLGFHFIENIGMCIGVMPVTGIPMPFFSNGGSAMVTNYIAIGIILSVSMRRKRAIFNSSQ